MSQTKQEKKITSEKPISLYGVKFKELMWAFLQVKPEENKKPNKSKKGLKNG